MDRDRTRSGPRRERFRAGYELVLDSIDLEKQILRFPSATFDLVVASHILEHLENASAALRNWHDVLRPGGIMIVGVPMHLAPVAWLAALRFRLCGRRPRGHCHFFSLRSLRRFLARYPVIEIAGFRIFSARKLLPLEDHRWFYDWSVRLGRRWPALTSEVNVVIAK
jgi:SAM-dependent methyltransferase